ATHAVTHVMEMQGRTDEGVAWLGAGEQHWAPSGLAYHNWWHLCLFHLDRGEPGQALAIYDRAIHPRATKVAYELVDSAALLWRLALRGVDPGPRWAALADDWE